MRRHNATAGARSTTTRFFVAASIACASCGAVLVASVVDALAQQQQRSINIPAGTLASALAAFGRQAELQVTYRPEVVSGKQSPGTSGTLAPSAALNQILAGSGLEYYFTNEKTVTVTERFAAAGNDDGALVLAPIDVSNSVGSGYQGTPDWVYQTPSSVSVISEEAIKNASVRGTRDLFNSVAGVYEGGAQGSFPVVSPNVRGLQDSGRIVVSIDGARQNSQDGGRYGASSLANFGTGFVDSAFIREIEIDKNTDSAVGFAGSLGGRVDFRTVNPDDILEPGDTWGVEMSGTTGTNEYNIKSSIVGAATAGNLSLLGGFSWLNLGEYVGGTQGEISDDIGQLKGRDAWSSLLKLTGAFGDLETKISWMHQENDYKYTASSVAYPNVIDGINDSATFEIEWNPDNPLIDVDANIWLNHAQIDETRLPRGSSTYNTYVDKSLMSYGGWIQNSSAFETATGPLTLSYGVEAFIDDADRDVYSEVIDENPLYATRYGTFNPPGRRDVASAFVNGEWEPTDWLKIIGGLRYDWYHLKGTSTYLERNPTEVAECIDLWPDLPLPGLCGEIIDGDFYWAGNELPATYTPHDIAISRHQGALLPSITLEFAPLDWLKPYASYTHSFRPPTITEAFFSGGLAPGDSVSDEGAPNRYLEPETARTWEVGANVSVDGLFTERDSFRLKTAAFYRNIEDYIVMGYITTPEALGDEYLSFVNLDGTTRMAGIELEGNYDEGAFWLGGAFTFLKAKWPDKTDIYSNGSVIEKCQAYQDDGCGERTDTSGGVFAVAGYVPPRFKVSLDGGIRMFEQRLALGMRINHVTPTMTRIVENDGTVREASDPYTTFDLYGSYQINDFATLRFGVNNLTDRKYVAATGFYTAPGRTILGTLELNYRF